MHKKGVAHIKTISINNRRYLGNKYRLLSFITKVVKSECNDILSVADVFAGTGVVADAFKDKKIITNDILYSNYLCHVAWFGNEPVDLKKLETYIEEFNSLKNLKPNYMSKNFKDTFFSDFNCRKIGYIREKIEKEYKKKKINERERSCLIVSLLYAMDKIANTCGHYDAYRQGEDLERDLILCMPDICYSNNPNNKQYNMDTNELIRTIEADLVYIDPPYNSRQYCDAYHLLENVAKWEKPPVEGVAKKMDRSNLKSHYCTSKATEAFEDLIANTKAKYILLSYNNMSKKGNDRSNARIEDKEIMRILKSKGKVKIFEEDYKAFSTGKTNIKDHKERLFLCICDNKESKPIIPSPINYTGGKYKLLPQILPLFPEKIDTFVDLFAGGCNVGVNVNANKVLFYEKNEELVGLFRSFQETKKEVFFEEVYSLIDKYNLSKSWELGYSSYNVNGSDGFAKVNRENYLKLREDFNNYKEKDLKHYIMLYVLIVYSFNNQIRYNKNGEFNLPVGKRDFNKKMQSKLSDFMDAIQDNKHQFFVSDFRNVDLEDLTEKDLVYADPPYLITCAGYNEQNAWTEKDEQDLLDLLDKLNEKNIKFALSNVLESKGKTNEILKGWLEKNNYVVHYLNYNYSNSNYQTKNKDTNSTKEVLISNY